MLARAVMPVVIVLTETITSGTRKGDGWVGALQGVGPFKSATVTMPRSNLRSGTGKPRKLETQNMVGAPFNGKRTDEGAVIDRR